MKNYIPPHAVCYYDASISLGLDAKEFDARLAAIEGKIASSTKKMSSSFAGIGGGLGGLGGLLSVGAIAATVKGLTDYSARIYDLGQRFGVSTDAIQHFGNAAEKNGSSLEAMTMAFNKLAISRSKALEGDQELVTAFQRLGISIMDLTKLKPEELMKKIGASSLNAAETVKVFGKNALEIRPTLAGIADGTIEIGDAINGIDIERLKKADTEWKKLLESLKIIGAELLSKTIPALQKVGEAAFNAFDKVKHLVLSTIPGHVAEETGEEMIRRDARKTAAQKDAILKGGQYPTAPAGTSGKPKRDFSMEVDESAEIRKESLKLTLAELAGRDAYGEGAVHRGKYIGGDILKAQAAQREKGLMDDALFAGHDVEAGGHKQRFESLTQGIGSLKSAEKNPFKTALSETEKKLDSIDKNTAKPLVNH